MKDLYLSNSIINNYIYLIHKYLDDDISQSCTLHFNTDLKVLNFMIDAMGPDGLITVVDNKVTYRLSSFEEEALDFGLDFIDTPMYERIGAFRNQYDFITVSDVINTVNDKKWQATLENLCFYLKPGGLCVIHSSVTPIKTTEFKTHSLGVWKAIVNKTADCKIIETLPLDSLNFLDNYYFTDLIVVRKNEKYKTDSF